MKSVLKQTIYEDDFRDKMNEILDGVLSEIEGALAAELEAEEKRAQHRVDVKIWKDETNSVRLDVYAELIKLAGSDGKSWARGFFPKKTAGKKLSAEESANLLEARAKKKMKKAALIFEREKDGLEKATQKAAAEKEKAEIEARLAADLKKRASGKDSGSVPEVPVPTPSPVPATEQHEEPASM